MNNRQNIPSLLLRRALAAVGLLVLSCGTLQGVRAQTAGGTQIQNQASASYSDGSTSYTTVSNTVTVTVANVSGLAITPDAGSNPAIVAGQTGVDFAFTVTNTSNFATRVRFLASGASIALAGPATVTAAVIDINSNGIDAGDTDVFTNGANVDSASIARNATIIVIVRVNISAAAAAGSTVSVTLGDAAGGAPTYDNQTANNSAAEVRTASGTSAPVNGESEARGSISATVENDAQLRLSINYPAGPVALGSAISYTYDVCNTGQRTASQQTLAGAPSGSNTGVFVIVPVPVGTDFTSITPPGGVSVLYSTSALTNDPLAAGTVWTTSAPASGVTRVAFNVGASVAAGSCVSSLQLSVTVRTNINASTPIYAVGDAFARNTVNAGVTDQSGDAVSGKGDGNADFNEPRLGTDPATGTQGFRVPTTLVLTGAVLVGPSGFPAAVGPTNNNDDYTNKSVAPAVVAGLGFGSNTASAATVDFVNTVRNTGNGNDTFTLTAPTVPAGFTVQVDAGSGFVTISSGGSTTVAVNFGQDVNVTVRVTAPSGSAVLNGFSVVLRATSANTPASSNDTIDRLYTGFLRLTKTATVINATGVGAPTDAVPGADIEYAITYQNISSGGGTNCVQLVASSVVITENGSLAPNNWASTTSQVVGSASDTLGGGITGDSAGSSVLTDTIGTLNPGQSGVFTFRRRIN
jgi:hypothetical protein